MYDKQRRLSDVLTVSNIVEPLFKEARVRASCSGLKSGIHTYLLMFSLAAALDDDDSNQSLPSC